MTSHHRKAYGAQRRTTPVFKARNVAESMQKHGVDIDDPATWSRYGIAEDSEQGRLVIKALCAMAPGRSEPYLDRP